MAVLDILFVVEPYYLIKNAVEIIASLHGADAVRGYTPCDLCYPFRCWGCRRCSRRPHYGVLGCRPIYCAKHKEANMVHLLKEATTREKMGVTRYEGKASDRPRRWGAFAAPLA